MVSRGSMARARSWHVLLVPTVVVAAAAAVLDVVQWLGAAPLWVDEEMIALNIRDRGFDSLPGALWLGQAAPLGWLFVQRAVLTVLGSSELSLRLLSLLFGLATLAAAAWVGERWMKRTAAVLFVLLCAFGEWMFQYRFELKHYSADVLFALLLPALAVRTTEADAASAPARWQNWWIAAALAQWFAFGAALVTPFCAVLLGIWIFRRFGARAAARYAASGILWAVSFGAHYLISMRFASGSAYLRNYWAEYLVPRGEGLAATLRWLGDRFEELPLDPGGTSLGLGLWVCALLGFALCGRRALAAMFVSVPFAATVLGLFGLVPLGGRIALWIVPALYLGLALFVDFALHQLAAAWRARHRVSLAAAAIVSIAAIAVSANIVIRGAARVHVLEPLETNRGMNDRAAVAWLMSRHRPGDVVMSTRLGWPAVWWYGNIPINRRIPGGYMRDGSVMFEVTHTREDPGCRERLQAAFEKYHRIIVHVGFPDTPPNFFEMLLVELSRLGKIVERSDFADSRVAVVELQPPGTHPSPAPAVDTPENGLPRGCVEVFSARRW